MCIFYNLYYIALFSKQIQLTVHVQIQYDSQLYHIPNANQTVRMSTKTLTRQIHFHTPTAICLLPLYTYMQACHIIMNSQLHIVIYGWIPVSSCTDTLKKKNRIKNSIIRAWLVYKWFQTLEVLLAKWDRNYGVAYRRSVDTVPWLIRLSATTLNGMRIDKWETSFSLIPAVR